MNSNKMSDMAIGQPHFSRSAGGVITDSVTNLQWLPGPNRDTDYEQAKHWFASRTMAGGGWRMPTREELKTLYDPSLEDHISPLFETASGRWLWAEPRDSSSAWYVDLSDGNDYWIDRDNFSNRRVFAVRMDPRHVNANRFSLDADRVISDAKTNLQWLPGPDRDTNYSQAEEWVVSQTGAGGGWRMPTRDELQTLYDPSCDFHISPVFKANGQRWVWAEPRDSSSAWRFGFNDGDAYWSSRDYSFNLRVFAVRLRE